MKVGVDGILLGAWASVKSAKTILDIGTGTGLLTLMLAQRNLEADLTAIEIDPSASYQALENFHGSPWSNRIQLINSDFQSFATATTHSFDLIVCNPPFYQSQQLSGSRQFAREQTLLTPLEVIKTSSSLLSNQGKVAIIIPSAQGSEIKKLSQEIGLNLFRETQVKSTPKKAFHRCLLEFHTQKSKPICDELIIETSRHHYSSQYEQLTQDFLLKNLAKK